MGEGMTVVSSLYLAELGHGMMLSLTSMVFDIGVGTWWQSIDWKTIPLPCLLYSRPYGKQETPS